MGLGLEEAEFPIDQCCRSQASRHRAGRQVRCSAVPLEARLASQRDGNTSPLLGGCWGNSRGQVVFRDMFYCLASVFNAVTHLQKSRAALKPGRSGGRAGPLHSPVLSSYFFLAPSAQALPWAAEKQGFMSSFATDATVHPWASHLVSLCLFG